MERQKKTFETPKAEVILFDRDKFASSSNENETPGMPYSLGDYDL